VRTFILLALAPTVWADSARDALVAREAQAMRLKLVELRRDFHMHPELSNREVRTGQTIAARLREIGFDRVKTGVALNGVVAVLEGGRPGPVVAIRADMDALPVDETIDVPYKSRNPGVKHACGHDIHMTVQLGVAGLLSKLRDRIPGTVKFIFQPAEEGPPRGEEGGARLMVKQGVLDAPAPQAIFGLHATPALEAGTVGYAPGPMLASGDRFVIRIRGKKSHGAWPHQGIDTAVIASEAVLALQSIRSRRIDPLQPMVLTIGSIHGGNRFNILADEVVMEGTVRTLDEDVRGKVRGLMREVLEGVAKAHGATAELDYETLYSVTSNDVALTARMLPVLERTLGARNVILQKPVMGAEDFSEFQKKIPGMFYWLGTANREKGISAGLHTADYDADENSLVTGVIAMTSLVWDYLENK
jgi:amidohydrolase